MSPRQEGLVYNGTVWAPVVSRETWIAFYCREIAKALQAQGIGKQATAQEINLALRGVERFPRRRGDRLDDGRYSTFRRAVRRICDERARLAEWEGRDPAPLRARRRSRAKGVA